MGLLEFLGDILGDLLTPSRDGSSDKKGNDGCFWCGLVIFFIFIGVFVWLNIN